MRVLIVADTTDRSESFLFHALVEAGIELGVICNPGASVMASLKAEGILCEPCLLKGRMDIKAIGRIRQRVRSEQPDIIHTFTSRALSNTLLAVRGMTVGVVAYRGALGHMRRWDPASWLTYFNPRVDRIVCVCRAVRDHLMSLGIPEAKLRTIYKGHDLSWYESKRPATLADVGIPEESFTVGFLGTVRRAKGADVLVRAAHRLPASLNVHILMVGAIREPAILESIEDDRVRDRIHCTGFREDGAFLMGACDAFAMPSTPSEGLSRALLEAMAQGVPPIVSDAGGLPEVVVDGEHGLIVPQKDPAGLADAIRALADDRSRCVLLGQQARERVDRDFNVRDTVAQTLGLYRELLDAPGGGS
jgi:glycosyltransferase involved in cell wall biosynthesis